MLKIRHLGAALVAALLLSTPVLASGFWPNLPASTSPGTAPTTEAPSTATGQTIGDNDCIPMDTGNASGIIPTTMCVSPSQLANYVGDLTPTFRYTTVPVGSVAYGSFGNATTYVAGTTYYAQLNIPESMTITNIACLNGGTVGTDEVIYGLWNSGGTLVANTALAGTTTSGANAFQSIALTATYAAIAGRYWVGVQANGTTDGVRTVAANTFVDVLTTSDTGTFATLETLTVPTTFTANVGPICYVD